MFIELNGKINSIKKDIHDEHIKIRHYIDNSENYDINIVCCELEDIYSLEKNWLKIIDNIAMYIQSELAEDIECYNIYTIFFCQDAPQSLINLIEHDKYSSRKIAINQNMPTSNIELLSFINERLFTININSEEQNNAPTNADIDSETLETLNIINNKNYSLKEKLEKILKETLD